MAVQWGFMPPPSQALRDYAAELYARRAEGVVAPRQVITVGAWNPQPNLCHDNALSLAERDETYTAVHGWLYFDLGGVMPFVRFAAHSVVQNQRNELIDITPLAQPAALYPFIRSNLSVEEFADAVNVLVAAHGSSNCLDHWLA